MKTTYFATASSPHSAWLFQFGATQRIPGGGHRDTVAREPDGVRHRLAGCLVRAVQTQLWSRAHTERPGRASRSWTNQDHCECPAVGRCGPVTPFVFRGLPGEVGHDVNTEKTEYMLMYCEDRGTRWRSWFRHGATSRKVAGSIQ